MTIAALFQHGIRRLFIFGLVIVLAACGGGGSGGGETSHNAMSIKSSSSSSRSNSSNIDSFLMGGAIQGASLKLANMVTTFAGTKGSEQVGDTHPSGSVSDGTNIYVADTNHHKILKIEIATGAITTIAGGRSSGNSDGTGTEASFNSPQGITSDGTNLYVADRDNQKIRKIVIATGVVTTFAGSGTYGHADGADTVAMFNSPTDVASDGTNLYVTDAGAIRKIVIATGSVTTLAVDNFGGNGGKGIATDGNNLYYSGGLGNEIRKIVIATGVTTTIAGGPYDYVDYTGTAERFDSPNGITTDGTNLYVADTGNHKIRKIVIATGVVTTLAGSGLSGSSDGTGSTASFINPIDITNDGANLYVTDTSYHKIRKIELATGIVTTIDDSPLLYVDSTGTAARFDSPNGITSDGTNLYITDSGNHKIRKVEIASGDVTTLAGDSQGNADGTGTAANFFSPSGITTDGTNLYVTDTGNNRIRKVEIATGVVTTLAGDSKGDADGTGTAASFDSPSGITTDGINLYVADTRNYKIRKITMATGVVETLAGSNLSFSLGEDGIGPGASFRAPRGITTDGTNLYVVDGDMIRKIVITTGVVTTIAGSRFFTGHSDSVDSIRATLFNHPSGITSDGTNLYIADTWNHSIRKVAIATGWVMTVAGGGSGSGFDLPSGITTDGFDLFVTDTNNRTIRKIH